MTRKEKLILAVAALLGCAALAYVLFGPSAYPAIRRLTAEKAGLETEVETLEKRQEELRKKAKRFQEDPRLVERRAREDLGMVREGETVIIIPDKSGDGRR